MSHKENSYHYNKYKQCEENNIKLYNIFSDEWLNRNTQIKNHLKRELGYCTRKVNAASCKLEEVSKEKAVAFYSSNGLRPIGNSRQIYKTFGIFTKKGELLCCLIYMDYDEKVRLLRPAYLENLTIRNFHKLTKDILIDKPTFAKTDNRLDSDWPQLDFDFTFLEDEQPKFRYIRAGKEDRYIEKPHNVKIGKVYNAGRKVWLLTPTGT